MYRYYRVFLLTYGLVHVLAGVVLWMVPSATHLFLSPPLAANAVPLLGFLSALAGLGFIAAAGVTERPQQRTAILACMAGNILNLVAHLQNVTFGYSPPLLAAVAVVSVTIFLAVLGSIYMSLPRS